MPTVLLVLLRFLLLAPPLHLLLPLYRLFLLGGATGNGLRDDADRVDFWVWDTIRAFS